MIKQCKATHIKDLARLPSSGDQFYWSIKYDGHYCQIHVLEDRIQFFTSSGKEFYEDNIAKEFLKHFPTGIYECEFLGLGEGKLGGRREAAVATTLRTNFSKRLPTSYHGCKLVVFDIINEDNFSRRFEVLDDLRRQLEDLLVFVSVARYNICYFSQAESIMNEICSNGYEGIILKHSLHKQRPGKRVKNAIKVKKINTIDAKVINIIEGSGKYIGKIGALRCIYNNIIIDVGSGLTDDMRNRPDSYWLGKTVEIAYEHKTEDAYIHPVFIDIRSDK